MHVVIFEDAQWETLAPLALSRPIFLLPSGTGTLLDRQVAMFSPSRLTLWVRPQLAAICRKEIEGKFTLPVAINEPLDSELALLVNARTLELTNFQMPRDAGVFVENDNSVRFAMVKSNPGLSQTDLKKLIDLPRLTSQGKFADHLWDLIRLNNELLTADFSRWKNRTNSMASGPWHLQNPQNIAAERDVKLSPGCVLDATRGPIMLDAGAIIGANSVLEGPCYIGRQSQIQPLTHIRPGTSIGMQCKIGGEVSNSIVSGYSNKAHYGYLGDSIVGSWVNLGAGTTTSNLKNTYGEVSIQIGQRELKTGRQNLGSLIGDHTKTAIGTRLNTGSYVGYCCLLAGQGLTPKFTPSFSFWTQDGTEKYQMNKAMEVATRMFGRREKAFDEDEQAIMRYADEVSPSVEN